MLAVGVVPEDRPQPLQVARAGREREQSHVVLSPRAPLLEAAEHDVEAARQVLRLAERLEVIVQELDDRARLVDREAGLALASDAADEEHERHRTVAGAGDQLLVAEVRLPVREVARVDAVEAAAAVEEDALERELVLGTEELGLGGEVDPHAEVLARLVRRGQHDLALLVEDVEVGDGEVERRDPQPVGEDGPPGFRQHEDVGEVDEAEVRAVGRVHHHAAVADAADRARGAVPGDQQEVPGEAALLHGDRRVVQHHLADDGLGLHLAGRAEGVPEDLERALEVRVIGVLDRLDLVLPRLALDHLDHVLGVEVLEAQADVGAEAHRSPRGARVGWVDERARQTVRVPHAS